MIHHINGLILRRPELSDLETLYQQKNDPEIAAMLVGFSHGYAQADLRDWLEFHRQCKDEVLWAIIKADSQKCIGHVGLYQIDLRVRNAEFGIIIGDKSFWGKGVGRACTKFAIEYGFQQLNLNRIQLSVLANNARAIKLYRTLGFCEEGCLRQAQYKNGEYLNVILMGLLRAEYITDAGK